MAAMSDEFERELARSLQRLREAIAPYTRFVRAEQQKLTRIEGELDEVRRYAWGRSGRGSRTL